MEFLRAYPAPFEKLLRELRRMPGIGSKSAERMGLWLLADGDGRAAALAAALVAAAGIVRPCRCCGFFAEGELCPICADPARAGAEICVVERATDILPIERAACFRGRYHALGGKLAPLDHIGPEQLRIAELFDRIADENPKEIILALSADVEGGATTLYLAGLLRERGIPVSRVAHGLPAGGGLEHADPLTLQSALGGRSRL